MANNEDVITITISNESRKSAQLTVDCSFSTKGSIIYAPFLLGKNQLKNIIEYAFKMGWRESVIGSTFKISMTGLEREDPSLLGRNL